MIRPFGSITKEDIENEIRAIVRICSTEKDQISSNFWPTVPYIGESTFSYSGYVDPISLMDSAISG